MRAPLLQLVLVVSAGAEPDPGQLLEKFAASLPLVHRSDGFDPKAGHPEWEPLRFKRSPAGNRDLLGTFQTGEQATLRLRGLPAHEFLLVRLDLAILCHWDGVWKDYGPDTWSASLHGGPKLLETTFSNFERARQNFPDETGPSTHPWRSGSASHGDLGWTLDMGARGGVWNDLDTTYQLWLAVRHDKPEALVEFSGSFHDNPDPPELRGECWAVSGCESWVVPAGMRPSEETIRQSAISEFDMAAPPHPAAVAVMVLAGTDGFPAIKKILTTCNLSALILPAPGVLEGQAPTALDQTIRDLASDDFKKREEASLQLKKLLPTNLDAVRKTRDSTNDPEVRERLELALREHHQAQLKPAEEEQPDKAAIAVRRLRHILRLTKAPQAEQWLEHLRLLAK
ncbi:MAG: hypothetical protein ABIT37_05630 [Luteolibacter sp.]